MYCKNQKNFVKKDKKPLEILEKTHIIVVWCYKYHCERTLKELGFGTWIGQRRHQVTPFLQKSSVLEH